MFRKQLNQKYEAISQNKLRSVKPQETAEEKNISKKYIGRVLRF